MIVVPFGSGRGALFGERYRVIVTSDIGGSDPDNYQSTVHYLLYSDCLIPHCPRARIKAPNP